MRIVNSVFQGAGVTTAAPVAIDVLIDSSMSGAGLGGLAGPSVSPGAATGQGAGSHAGAAALFTAAGYRDLASGIHNFVARVSGTTASFFRTDAGEFLPKQYVLPVPYTFILAGVDTTTPPDPSAVPWGGTITDDPFTPPADPAGGLTARVQVINAAPMADPKGNGQGTDANLVPYEQVYADYKAAALNQVDRADIPQSERDLVNQYFANLGQ